MWQPLAAFLALLALAGRKAAASTAPPAPKFPPPGRRARLVQRGAAGLPWLPELLAAGVPEEVALALTRWIGIESGGNPLALSRDGERGLLQMHHESARKAGLSETDWAALRNPTTPRSQHVALNLLLFRWLVAQAHRLGFTAGQAPLEDAWAAKLYHGLPLLVRELGQQRLLQQRDHLQVRRAALAGVDGYKPSPRTLRYSFSPRSAAGLVDRFMTSADVVVDG